MILVSWCGGFLGWHVFCITRDSWDKVAKSGHLWLNETNCQKRSCLPTFSSKTHLPLPTSNLI